MTTTAAPRARLPRTLAALASHPWVESIDDARDTGDNLHVYLKPGFVWAGTTSAVIEPTVREACQAFREVAWDPAAWGEASGASPAEVAALTGEAAPAPAAPAPATGRRLNPLAEILLTRLQAAGGQWLMVEAAPIVDTLKGLGWLQRSDVQGLIGPEGIPAVECRITAAGLAALAARPCDGGAAPAPRPVLPGEATPPPAPSHGEAAPVLPVLTEHPCPVGKGDPARAEAVVEVPYGVAVICSGSTREAFRLPDTVSLCGAAAALEAGGWILSPALEALARRWRDITGGQDPAPEVVAIAEAAAPRLKRFRVFHRTWWRENADWPDGREPGVGESHHVAWANTEAHARHLCRRWNAAHPAGPLSDRAEFEAA